MPHINNYINFTAETFLVYQNKVLLRYHEKYDYWLSVGGHIEPNEDPNQAAIREVKEETGLDVALYDKLLPFKENNARYQELIPPYFMNIHKISDTHRHVTLVYFARAKNDKIIEPENEKSRGWKWMSKTELEAASNLLPSIKFYALKALAELGE